MSFPRYPEYKDSGIEWLGEVPGHWEVVKLGYLAISKGGGTPPKDELQYWNGSIPWVTPKDMKQQWITSTIDTLSEAALPVAPVSMIEPGHVLIVFRSGILRHRIPVAINQVPVTVNQDIRAYNVRPRLLPYFFFRLTQGLNRELLPEWSKQGATVESLDSELVNSTLLPIPPQGEQEAITTFLDHETARIDALVEEQQRLIELLKEKRQAVISHAVTKGLDPDAPMKDSGVEWLGEVPAHWVLAALRWFVRCSSGEAIGRGYVSSERGEGKFPVAGGNGVIGYSEAQNVASGSIVIGRVGALCGNVHLILEPAWVTDNALWLEWDKRKFVSSYIKEVLFARRLNEIASKTAQPLITSSQVKDQVVPIPPLHEQEEISSWLTSELLKIDALVKQAQKGIELLSERRSAIISAAVTGKIDVRGWKADQYSEQPEVLMAAEECATYA